MANLTGPGGFVGPDGSYLPPHTPIPDGWLDDDSLAHALETGGAVEGEVPTPDEAADPNTTPEPPSAGGATDAPQPQPPNARSQPPSADTVAPQDGGA